VLRVTVGTAIGDGCRYMNTVEPQLGLEISSLDEESTKVVYACMLNKYILGADVLDKYVF